MAGTRPTLTNDGPIPAPFTAILQSLGRNSALAQATALQVSSNTLDEYQNTTRISGPLNQVVTIGAGWISGSPVMGVEVGTNLSDFGEAWPSGFVHTTCTISSANLAASQIVVASATGLATGMVIGATVYETPPSFDEQAPANYIVPGSTITGISGTTITLSIAPAFTSSTPLYCCACVWNLPGSANAFTPVHP